MLNDFSFFITYLVIACDVLMEENTQDKLPDGYGTIPGRCTAKWSCADWMRTGHCDTDWSEFSECAPGAKGKIKDDCKDACNRNDNKCGKFNISMTLVGN